MPGLDFIQPELAALAAAGLTRRAPAIIGAQGPRVRVDGRAVVAFCSNDYLGLANHPALRAAAAAALDTGGHGAGASRLISGNLEAHRELEATLARFHGTEAALLFSSGYQANVGTLSALFGPEDLICSDALNHASIIDGCRLGRAQVRVYRHGDVDDLARHLATPARRKLVVTDAVFSMEGDRAPLRGLRAAADAHGAALMVDEAHSVGVVGPGGTGLAAELGVVPDILVGTLGKAFGAAGAYVAGSKPLTELLLNRARSFVFTTAPTVPTAAAAATAVTLAAGPAGDALRARLASHVEQFADGLRALDLPVPEHPSAIFPVIVGDNRKTMEASAALLELGVFAHGIRPPTVPAGTGRLRFALSAAHEPQDLAQCLGALAQVAAHFVPR